MEKVIYALWRRSGDSREALNARLLDEAASALLALPMVRALRINLQDAAVADAEGLRMNCPGAEQPDAAVQLWIDASHAPFRTPVDDILMGVAARIAAWSVISSTIIRNVDHPPTAGARTHGWSQLCFLKRPAHLDAANWRHNWQELHTQVAIDTQANFEYVQNLIARPLIAGPQDYAAVVEECFPPAAMTDSHVFFDAANDPERFARNTTAMAESCARFIGEGCVDLLPTSQYDLRTL